VCNYFTVKVSVSYFKVDKSENLDNSFYAFTFFDVTLKKRKKSRFWILKKNVKNVFSRHIHTKEMNDTKRTSIELHELTTVK